MIGAHYLDSDDLVDLANESAFVDVVREAYREHGNGAPTHPRTTLTTDDPDGMLTSYMAILPEMGVMGGYMYSAGFADADARFATPIFDANTGRPLAIVDGAQVNTHKTGAAGAVGIDALARDDADTVAVIGSGAQARGQLRAAIAVRELTDVRVYSPTQSHRETFATEMGDKLGIPIHAVSDSSTAVDGADIVITATNAREPVVADEDIEPGTHINAIGQYDPDKREIPGETVARAVYVPDLRERVFQDAGAFLQAREEGLVTDEHIHAELGAVVADRVPGRTDRDQVTMFDSGGTALETLSSAALLYRRAIEKGRGTEITFASASEVYTGKQGDTSEEL